MNFVVLASMWAACAVLVLVIDTLAAVRQRREEKLQLTPLEKVVSWAAFIITWVVINTLFAPLTAAIILARGKSTFEE